MCNLHRPFVYPTIYPRNHLKEQGMKRGKYNQIANLALTQSEINVRIGDDGPAVYFAKLAKQCNGGETEYGGIENLDEMYANLRMNCLLEAMLDGIIPCFEGFLEIRRKMMAGKIKAYFEEL